MLKPHEDDKVQLFSDEDDTSSQSECSEMEDDIKFSLPSNVLFFFGSFCGVTLSVLDLQWNLKWGDDDYYYYEYYYSHYNASTKSLKNKFSLYSCLSIGGAGLLILNAGLDLYRCLCTSKRDHMSLCGGDLRGDTCAAILFGIAATIDLRGALSSTGGPGGVNGVMWLLSSHLYLFSALSAMTSINYKCDSKPVVLNLVGDVMFLIGSLIDVVISYISDPDIISESQNVLLRLALLSSVLWLTDAMLYISANFLVWNRRRQKNKFQGEMIATGLIV
jgi:hypothetical protein